MKKRSKNRKRKYPFFLSCVLGIVLCFLIGCNGGNKNAGELEIADKTVDISSEQTSTAPLKSTASVEVTSKTIDKERKEIQKKYPISEEKVDVLSQEKLSHNIQIYEKLEQLQMAAQEYSKNSNGKEKSTLFTLQYIRQGNIAYQDNTWNLMAGREVDFETYVEKSEVTRNIGTQLRENKQLYDTVSDKSIDFLHMIATMNVYLKWDSVQLDGGEYGDIGGWAGDCIQLAREGKEAGIEIHQMSLYMEEHIGNDGYFGNEDMLADMDAYNIYQIIKEGKSISEAFSQYYSQLNEKKRFQLFLNYRFPTSETLEQLKEEITDVLLHGQSVLMTMVSQKEKVGGEDYLEHRRLAGECFAAYIWKQAGR